MNDFGKFIRNLREAKVATNKDYSLRKVSTRLKVEPSYLSRVERGDEKSISENFIKKLAVEFEQDPDVLLAMCGKVSSELKEIILKNPVIFSQLLQSLKNYPEHAILKIVREVRDGNW